MDYGKAVNDLTLFNCTAQAEIQISLKQDTAADCNISQINFILKYTKKM